MVDERVLELASDAVVCLLEVGSVDIHLLVEPVELVVLSVQLTSHVSRYTLQISQHIRHRPGREGEIREKDREKRRNGGGDTE